MIRRQEREPSAVLYLMSGRRRGLVRPPAKGIEELSCLGVPGVQRENLLKVLSAFSGLVCAQAG